jgi:hypothetical protein
MSPTARRRLSLACITAGALALMLGLPFAYLDRNVFEARGFADNAAATLQQQPVRDELAVQITDGLVRANPQAVSFVPLIQGVGDTLLQTAPAAGLVRAAAVETHNAIFSKTEGSIVVDLASLGVIALELVEVRNPKLARDLSRPRQIALQLSDRSLTVGAIRLAERVRLLAVALPLLALVLLGAGLFLNPDRRRGALDAGVGILLAGALSFAGYLIVRAVVVAGSDGTERDVVAAVFDTFIARLPVWCAIVGLTGAIVAASAASLMREVDPAAIPGALWARITRDPERTWERVGGAVVLVLLGAWIIGDPLGAVRFVTLVLGAWLVFAGVVTLLRMLVGPEPDEAHEMTTSELRRRFVPAALAGLVVVLGTGFGIGLVLDSRARPEPVVNENPGCNGFLELCDRRLDEVTFAATHNSDSSAQAGFLNANHGIDIMSQLQVGIRGLLIDAYLGQRNEDGTVRTDLAPKAVAAAEAKIGPEGLAAAQRLAGSVVFGPVSGKTQVYLCHVVCELGAVEAVPEFRRIRDWLDINPREVLIIAVEDAAPTADIKRAFEAGGLAELATEVPIGEGVPLPTLEELIDSGKRVLIMAEENGEATGWYRRMYDITQETPFRFTKPAQLEADASCRPNRGGTTPPLFLVNHWIETYPPRPQNASIVNQPDFVVDRARRCQRIRDRVPTLIAVDFVERGDLVGAVDELNGVVFDGAATGSGTPQAP